MPLEFNKFRDDEDGAVTTDWVVLVAAIIIFSLYIASTIRDNTVIAGDALGEKIANLADD